MIVYMEYDKDGNKVDKEIEISDKCFAIEIRVKLSVTQVMLTDFEKIYGRSFENVLEDQLRDSFMEEFENDLKLPISAKLELEIIP